MGPVAAALLLPIAGSRAVKRIPEPVLRRVGAVIMGLHGLSTRR